MDTFNNHLDNGARDIVKRFKQCYKDIEVICAKCEYVIEHNRCTIDHMTLGHVVKKCIIFNLISMED